MSIDLEKPIDLELEVLSPLHIDTGKTISPRYDYVFDESRSVVRVIDLDSLLDQEQKIDVEDLVRRMSQEGFQIGHYLKNMRISSTEVERYHVFSRSDPGDKEIKVAIKDVYNRAYIPGTSLKGAIRTALLWKLLKSNNEAYLFFKRYLNLFMKSREIAEEVERLAGQNKKDLLDPRIHLRAIANLMGNSLAEDYRYILYRLSRKNLRRAIEGDRRHRIGPREIRNMERNSRYVAQPVERHKDIFGIDPNHDLLRALQISDSNPVSSDAFELTDVISYEIDGQELKPDKGQTNFVESLKEQTRLTFQIKFDNFIFDSDSAQSELRFRNRRQWIDPKRCLFAVCNEFAGALINSEIAFHKKYGSSTVAQWCNDLLEEIKESNSCLLPVGWGTGYLTKTVSKILQNDLEFDFEELRWLYRLGKSRTTGSYHSVFPKSRRLAAMNNEPCYPMGWIKVRILV